MKGFTLIEMLIVIAIVGILAALAYPSYQRHKVNSHRADAEALMAEMSLQLERWYARGFTYATFPAANQIGQSPATGTARYNIAYNITAQTFTITSTPTAGGSQAGDGRLVFNNTGQKCWFKGHDAGGGSCQTP